MQSLAIFFTLIKVVVKAKFLQTETILHTGKPTTPFSELSFHEAS